MKKKISLPLLALLTAGSMFILSGCNADLTTINEEEVSIEEAMEEQNLAEGMVMLHSVWTNADGDSLAGASVTIYDDGSNIYSGVTESNGSLATFIIPCNTELICSVTDSAGNTLAESEFIFKLSEDYSEFSIYPPQASDDEDSIAVCTLEIPIEKTNLRTAMFLTGDGVVSIANITPYIEPDSAPEETEDALEEEAEAAVEEQELDEEAEDIEAEDEIIEEEAGEEESNDEESHEEESYDEEAED